MLRRTDLGAEAPLSGRFGLSYAGSKSPEGDAGDLFKYESGRWKVHGSDGEDEALEMVRTLLRAGASVSMIEAAEDLPGENSAELRGPSPPSTGVDEDS